MFEASREEPKHDLHNIDDQQVTQQNRPLDDH